MVAKNPTPRTIDKPKLLLVEGKDEELFFCSMIKKMRYTSEIDVWSIDGKDKLRRGLKAVKIASGYPLLTSLGVIRDADNNADSAFQSVCSALRNTGWPVPTRPLESTGDSPKVTECTAGRQIHRNAGRCISGISS